jgi:hypothetical protein
MGGDRAAGLDVVSRPTPARAKLGGRAAAAPAGPAPEGEERWG